MAIVVFDPANFRKAYPAYQDEVTYPDELLQSYFDLATMFVKNTENALVPYEPEKGIKDREVVLNAVMCHLLGLDALPQNQVGRVSSARQGSVSTAFDLLNAKSGSAAWWMQTRCGALYWHLMARYRLGGRIHTISRFHPWG